VQKGGAQVSEIIAAVGATITAVKFIKDHMDASQEGRERLMELTNKLLELQLLTNDLVNINAQLESKVRELEETLATKEAVYYKNDVVFLEGEEGENAGPYCPACWGQHEKLIHLYFLIAEMTGKQWECSVCKYTIYRDEDLIK
jgi:hypothetical protein